MTVRRTIAPADLPSTTELEQSVLYSEEIGIDLALGRDTDTFHWFLASILFGSHISETIAKNTYRALARGA